MEYSKPLILKGDKIMAVKEFNCNKMKRTFWTFTMKDETDETGSVKKGQRLIVRMPQKGVFEAIKDITAGGEEIIEDTESVYRLLAAILNNNMNQVKITIEDVSDYDIEECTAILSAYMEFVDELKSDPN